MDRVREWLLLAISGVLTLMGLVLVIAGRGVGITVMIFFGACAGVAIVVLRRRARASAQLGDPGLEVRVGDGLAEVLVDTRRRQRGAGLGLMIFGPILAVTGAELGPSFVQISWLLGACGAVVLIALALGWRSGHALYFSDDALWIRGGSRLLYPLHWDNVAGVELFELQSNLLVGIALHDPARVVASVEDPSGGEVTRARARLDRAMKTTRLLGMGHAMINPGAYGVEPVILLRAITRYARDPRARAELRPRSTLATPAG
ncbi:MAG: hypothetical protein R3B09_27495 [Nannocystaceae bacterium]